MTTIVTHSIGSGKDYATVALWDAACPSDLTAVDQIWKGEIYDELTVSANTTIASVTTDATRYKWLTAAATKSFADSIGALTYTTGKAGMTGAMGSSVTLLTVSCDNTLIDRLQFRQTATAGPPGNVIATGTAKTWTIRGCIVDQAAANACITVGAAAVGASNDIINSVFVTRNAGTLDHAILNAGTQVLRVTGCTLFNLGAAATQYGMRALTSATITAVDNAIFGFTNATAVSSGFFTSSDYNCTDNSSVLGSGTHNQVSKTTSAQFRDINSGTLDLRCATSGSDLANNGQRQNTYTADLDIFGQARSTSTPTIGAFELQSTATGTKQLLMLGAG